MTQLSHRYYETKPHFSLPSIIAIIAGILSLFSGAGLGLFLAVVAVIAGAIGVLLAFAPQVRGGFVSIISIIVGLLAFLVGIGKLIF